MGEKLDVLGREYLNLERLSRTSYEADGSTYHQIEAHVDGRQYKGWQPDHPPKFLHDHRHPDDHPGVVCACGCAKFILTHRPYALDATCVCCGATEEVYSG